MTNALRLQGITKRFGDTVANQDISLDVWRGEIHALLGENGAGKTTLMNIVFGLLTPDAGTIEVAGQTVGIGNPGVAADLGIGMVHQHFKLVRDLTVAENVALGRGSRALGRLRLPEVRATLRMLSRRFGIEVDPDARIDELSVAEQQRVEIMKLLYRDVALLILDEPTGVLTSTEWQRLASVLRSLAESGRAIIFISHKLEEVTRIADRCTILRDGRVVGTLPLRDVGKRQLAQMMVGRAATDPAFRVERESPVPDEPVLQVNGLGAAEHGRAVLADIGITVAPHEVVGIAGVDGNGQRELVEAITGVRRFTGEIMLGRQRLHRHSPADFISAGGALVPADRHRTGVLENLSVIDNLLLETYCQPPFARYGFLDKQAMRRHAARLVAEFDIRVNDLDLPVRQLSGGNQQKVVLARELDRRPQLLIVAQPTRGLDVGATGFIYERLARYKRQGGAILLISTALDEILLLADRIAVLAGGRLIQVLDAQEADAERLGMLIGGESLPGGRT